ncbi:hypothetical protein C7B65_18990 [Phormidesmis priestleyi ULC007]|uniref:CopG family transcriptional regulator n=1 Tax=Phormidesmis priestleyi ULC007 TaxID=1920490 RepID=A0A2T1DA24_9CYAN|nr:hypothetical protein [Phormidesmis priestleyi]PSB17362.1 hypothetical protein C7B65_18990 [Phormidesmis priestleyi ULC007]PZO48283.1 MAG: hypothetical protein DCF14_17305 [Phormidesmis priestleyi]
MNNPEENLKLHLRPRVTKTVALQVPVDVLESLKRVADSRDMPLEVLLRLYIGQGLRQDLTEVFSERVLETMAQVLARHIQSEEEISTILQEIQAETT